MTDVINIIDASQLQADQAQGVKVIDVRPSAMYKSGHIPNTWNIPLMSEDDGSILPDDELVADVEALGVNPNDKVTLYCQIGYNSQLAADILADNGFTNIDLYSGSMNDWTRKGLPIAM